MEHCPGTTSKHELRQPPRKFFSGHALAPVQRSFLRTKLTNKSHASNHFGAWYSQTALVFVALATE